MSTDGSDGSVVLTVSLNGLVPAVLERHRDIPGFVAELEAIGVDQVVIGEHLLQADVQHPGGVEVDLTQPFPDPFATLSAVAATTSTIRLTTGAVIAPTRSALVLAKLAATVDVISGGRFSLGVTSGWYETEFRAVGVPFEERFARLDEAVAACRALWGPQPASFEGRWTAFRDVYCQPTPIAGAALPVWYGGLVSARSARRVAACDGWIVSEATPATDIPAGIERIAAARAARGAPTASAGVRATVPRRVLGPPAAAVGLGAAAEMIRAVIGELAAAGATEVVVPVGEYVDGTAAALQLLSMLVDPAPAVVTATRDRGR